LRRQIKDLRALKKSSRNIERTLKLSIFSVEF
jgi:hypothetical protein